MSWSKVGELAFSVAAGAGTENKTLPGTVLEDDIVLILLGCDGSLAAASDGIDAAGQGYSNIDYQDDPSPGRQLCYKIMGSTPDTIVTVRQHATLITTGVMQVWRGVDTSTPLDQTSVIVELQGSEGKPNPGSITTVTDGALVFAFGVLDDDIDGGNITAPSGYTNLLAHSVSFGNATVMMASKEVTTAGAEDPAAFGGTMDDEWFAATVALRPASTGAAPVLTVPGAQAATFGTPKSISGVSVADDDTDIDTFEASCESGMTITFDADAVGSPPAVITGNGTNSVSFSATQAEINTILAAGIVVNRPESWPTHEASNILTLRVIDANDNEDEETITVNWTAAGAVFITSAFEATLQALEWTPPPAEAGTFNLLMVAETSEPLSDSDTFQITVVGASPVVAVPTTKNGQYGVAKPINGVSVSHADSLTTHLRFRSPVVMPMTFDPDVIGSPGATITGNGSNDVLIEVDPIADLNTVAGTMVVERATPVTPVPSNLVPASGNSYAIQSNAQVSDVVYTDRAHTFQTLPSVLTGAAWIKTPNDDKASSHAATLAFTLSAPAWVYVSYDVRGYDTHPFPEWLTDWELTTTLEVSISAQPFEFDVYRKSFAAGTVTLGGYDFGLLNSNYSVFIIPIDPLMTVRVTAIDVNDHSDEKSFNVAWSIEGNTPPVANAGPDQNVVVEVEVQLDGSGSSDPEASALTYLWAITEQPPGSAAALSDATIVNPTFTPDLSGTYIIRLVVNDGDDNSVPDHITVTAGGILVANAGPDQLIAAGSLVQLDGSGSLNYDTLLWEFLLKPDGSLAVLSNAAITNPTFLPDLPGIYSLRLTAFDAASPAESVTDTVIVTASELAAIAPMFVAASRPPTVPGNRRKAGVPVAAVELWKYPKDLYDVAVDWEEDDVLPAGATSLSTLTVAIKDSGGNDVTETLLADIGVEGFVSWAQLQAGTAGQVYDVILTQLFNNGQRLDRYVKVQVRDPRSYVVHAPFKYPADKYPIPVEWAGRRPRGNPALSTLITKAYDASDVDETSTYLAGSFVTGTIGAGYVIGGTGGESRLLEFAQQFSNGRTFHEYAMLTVEVPPA